MPRIPALVIPKNVLVPLVQSKIGDTTSFEVSLKTDRDRPLQISDTATFQFTLSHGSGKITRAKIDNVSDGVIYVTIDAEETATILSPIRAPWELKLIDDKNVYTVAHGKIAFARSL